MLMNGQFAVLALVGLLQAAPVDVSVVTVPPDSQVDLRLTPEGDVEIRREATLSRVRIEVDRVVPLTAFRPDFRSWVVWAVSPEGEFTNLGELEPDGQGARLETMTPAARFGILVTAEPHFRVSTPGATVGFRSTAARRNETRIESLRVDVGQEDYSGVTLPPQGSIHPRVTQARMAVAIAEAEPSGTTASSELREARVALDSLEQLLRRETPMRVVLPYADDAIRLADLAVRQARSAIAEARRREDERRARELETSLARARGESERAAAREREASARVTELLQEIEDVRSANRTLTIERDSRVRDLGQAESQIQSLEDPWPPLRMALIYRFGARETPRGLVMTLPPSAFGDIGLQPETREWLARLSGTLGYGEVPEVWIEGHSRQELAREVSEERASAVRDYLVETGLPEVRLQARGLGDLNPIPGAEEAGAGDLNERVEIIVRQLGTL